MPVASREELIQLMKAIHRVNSGVNENWDHPDPHIRETLREYMSIWRKAEQDG